MCWGFFICTSRSSQKPSSISLDKTLKGVISKVGHIDVHRMWLLGRAQAHNLASTGSKTIKHGVTG